MNHTREFWERIYRENSQKLKGICMRYVTDNATAEDLMHDAFMTAIRSSESYAGRGSIEAWLRKITINTALQYIRYKNSRLIQEDMYYHSSEFNEMSNTDTSENIQSIEQADFSAEELLGAINLLPQHHKLVFNLYVIDGYSHEQIGKELGISTGTSKSHLARARKKLIEVLSGLANEKHVSIRKKTKAAILLLFPFRTESIDLIFRKKLLNFSAATQFPSPTIFDLTDWNTLKNPAFFRVNPYIKMRYRVFGIITGIVLLSCFLLTRQIHEVNPLPFKKQKDDSVFEMTHSSSEPGNYLKDTNSTSSKRSVKVSMKPTPVIVRKTLIQRQTIVVRDTVKIVE